MTTKTKPPTVCKDIDADLNEPILNNNKEINNGNGNEIGTYKKKKEKNNYLNGTNILYTKSKNYLPLFFYNIIFIFFFLNTQHSNVC